MKRTGRGTAPKTISRSLRRFAALARAESAPDAEVGRTAVADAARPRREKVRIVATLAIDRIGNETDGAVAHRDLATAGVIA